MPVQVYLIKKFMSRSNNTDNKLNFEEMFFTMKFDQLREYIELALKYSKQASEEINQGILNWDSKNLDPQFSGHDVYEDDFLSLCNFEDTIVTSTIILINSELETSLKFICNEYYKNVNRKINPKNIKGDNNLDNYKLYLEKIMDIDLSEINWKLLFSYNLLRNKIVHQNSKIILNEGEKLFSNKEYIKLKIINDVSISNSGAITLRNRNPLDEFIKLCLELLITIFEKQKNNETIH